MISGVVTAAVQGAKQWLPSPTLQRKASLAAIGILGTIGSVFRRSQNLASRVALGVIGASAVVCALLYSRIYETLHKTSSNPPAPPHSDGAGSAPRPTTPPPAPPAEGAAAESPPRTPNDESFDSLSTRATPPTSPAPGVVSLGAQPAVSVAALAGSAIPRPLPPPPAAGGGGQPSEPGTLPPLPAGGAAAAAAPPGLSLAPPPAPLTPQEREMRVRTPADPKSVADRLQNDVTRAAAQMAAASPKSFVYRDGGLQPWGLASDLATVAEFQVGVASAQGTRGQMEDAHCTIGSSVTIGATPYPMQIFGVFDGHGGPHVSAYVSQYIEAVLQGLLIEHNQEGFTDLGIYNALKHLGVRLQQNFEREFPGVSRQQGTCLTAAIILQGRLYTVNIGDSRIILVGPTGETRQLTADQKPVDFTEAIQRRGGNIYWGRVNGNLATARAIGDLDLGFAVSARGKVSDHGPLVSGSRIVVACDGIWDVASSGEIGAAVHAHRDVAPQDLAHNLVCSCSHSSDNLSLMIIAVP